MRILLLNGNTSESITEALFAEARRHAGGETEIVATRCERGANVVASRAAEVVAASAMLEAVAAVDEPFDAVLVAISFDTAVQALRELLPVPVVGMTEAACHVATMVGSRFGVVLPGERNAAVYRERIVACGFEPRFAGMRVVGSSAAALYADPENALEAIRIAAQALVDEDRCDAVILAGAALVGLHRRIQADCPVPLIDGIACGVGMLESLVRLKLPKPRAGSYAAPAPAQLQNIDPALAALFACPAVDRTHPGFRTEGDHDHEY
ncbi:aspartate/glutamate racemase family protein [Allohahella marinimesophila]|uniref:Aspartate/glutamate racemase family protein n=1 Tax=Allohahella marinimesophila TaxID=1054972 RepID=A0ABP7NRW2_9GAMM